MRAKSGFGELMRLEIASVKANVVPMLILQCAAVGLVAAYYFLPLFSALMESIADLHREYGWRAAFVSQAIFCGMLPGFFLLAFRSIRPRYPFLTILAQTLWCGIFGVCSNELFCLLAQTFGDNSHISTVLVKTAIDQFVWTVAVIAPANAVFFFWLGRDFSFARTRREWPSPFLRRMVMPNLLPNWVVWIPVSSVVFSLPFPLQIHVNGIVCTFWTLMCIQIGRHT